MNTWPATHLSGALCVTATPACLAWFREVLPARLPACLPTCHLPIPSGHNSSVYSTPALAWSVIARWSSPVFVRYWSLVSFARGCLSFNIWRLSFAVIRHHLSAFGFSGCLRSFLGRLYCHFACLLVLLMFIYPASTCCSRFLWSDSVYYLV